MTTNNLKPVDLTKILELLQPPQQSCALVFDSPHSGQSYPDDFNYACPLEELQKSEDRYVDELFAAAIDHGAPMLKAHFARSYIDVNRQAHDIDPEHIAGTLNFRAKPGMRSKFGTGLIRQVCRPRAPLPVYAEKLSAKEVHHRIASYYTPYHQALEELIEQTHQKFDHVLHINCHSMPSSVQKNLPPHFGPVDINLGDRDGTSANAALTEKLKEVFEDLGYRTHINRPFKGVALVQNYADPQLGKHSIQIEINRALYMNEESLEKTAKFDKLQQDLTQFIANISKIDLSQF